MPLVRVCMTWRLLVTDPAQVERLKGEDRCHGAYRDHKDHGVATGPVTLVFRP